ncbi:hypothetical protein CANCADRAFT_96410 [Tortispora caseinolytica NRRL Y-17796]|uniref:Uncharacterized protein n=1 Tax=Tortispora caseinolytica NRRL Y-17796 TaxID=767744 RepID=A0A1E4TMJ6_9ASCO|nr:hypothetical protein CANCADRAFT_96410 [Tortispora caseinolytica NRRL Y-17796]
MTSTVWSVITKTETYLCSPPVSTSTAYYRAYTSASGFAEVFDEDCKKASKSVSGWYCNACTPVAVTYVQEPPLESDGHVYVWPYYEQVEVSTSAGVDYSIEIPVVATTTIDPQPSSDTWGKYVLPNTYSPRSTHTPVLTQSIHALMRTRSHSAVTSNDADSKTSDIPSFHSDIPSLHSATLSLNSASHQAYATNSASPLSSLANNIMPNIRSRSDYSAESTSGDQSAQSDASYPSKTTNSASSQSVSAPAESSPAVEDRQLIPSVSSSSTSASSTISSYSLPYWNLSSFASNSKSSSESLSLSSNPLTSAAASLDTLIRSKSSSSIVSTVSSFSSFPISTFKSSVSASSSSVIESADPASTGVDPIIRSSSRSSIASAHSASPSSAAMNIDPVGLISSSSTVSSSVDPASDGADTLIRPGPILLLRALTLLLTVPTLLLDLAQALLHQHLQQSAPYLCHLGTHRVLRLHWNLHQSHQAHLQTLSPQLMLVVLTIVFGLYRGLRALTLPLSTLLLPRSTLQSKSTRVLQPRWILLHRLARL